MIPTFKRHQLEESFFIMPEFRHTISRILQSERTSPWLFPLLLISFLYRGCAGVRNLLYDAGIFKVRKLACKVISVGNITVGGTGKTPMVILLADILRGKGYRPAILSRGYGGKKKRRVNIVSDGKNLLMHPAKAGDEPALIAKSVMSVPVVTGKKRYLTGKFAIEHFGVDVLILDDAFQHRSLFRDVDIALLDYKKPFGNGFMIPRGELREPRNGLRRADIVIVTGTEKTEVRDGRPDLGGIPSGSHIFEAYRKPVALFGGSPIDVHPLECLHGKKIFAFAGIAKPDSFLRTIEFLGDPLVGFIDFPDHHVYTQEDVIKIRTAAAESSAQIILTTEKDGIKLIDFPDFLREIYQLRIEMEILPSQERFEDVLLERIRI